MCLRDQIFGENNGGCCVAMTGLRNLENTIETSAEKDETEFSMTTTEESIEEA